MKQKFLTALLCVCVLLIAGCGNAQGDPAATRISVTGNTMPTIQQLLQPMLLANGVTTSVPMPSSGVCSYEAAVESLTNVRHDYLTLTFAGVGVPLTVIHVERGVLVSFPEEVYYQLMAATPEARGTGAAMIMMTSASFDSVLQQHYPLHSSFLQLGLLSQGPFYVTSYECLPLHRYNQT